MGLNCSINLKWILFYSILRAPDWVMAHAKETPPPLSQKPALVLGLGEQRLLKIPGLHKYSLGSPIVHALSLPQSPWKSHASEKDSLLIKAVAIGSGGLWVWKSDGSSEYRPIRVEKRIPIEKNSLLAQALNRLEEAEVIFYGAGVVLRGKIYTLLECSKITALTQSFPKEIHDETESSEDLLLNAESQLNRWLKNSEHQHQLRLEKIGQSLWIRGNVDRRSDQISLEKEARRIYPAVQTEIESLPDHSPTVYFRVFLLELKRSQFHNIGISWPGSIMKSLPVTPGLAQDAVQLDLTLQQLEGNGNARILSNPELVVRAPGEAELFAGGELPIQNQSRFFSNVTWKKYGMTLRLKVSHIAGDRIRLEIYTEVSHLDTPVSQDKIPGIHTNHMKTQVDARFGSPLFLSGLLQQGMREEVKGLPFLRKIPVLGLLFGSEDYLNERSELVAILYPHTNPPPAPIRRTTFLAPKGQLPPPRNWISPEDEQKIRESKEFPWNALQ